MSTPVEINFDKDGFQYYTYGTVTYRINWAEYDPPLFWSKTREKWKQSHEFKTIDQFKAKLAEEDSLAVAVPKPNHVT